MKRIKSTWRWFILATLPVTESLFEPRIILTRRYWRAWFIHLCGVSLVAVVVAVILVSVLFPIALIFDWK